MHFYTSVNNHYMAKAIVLAESVKRHVRGATFTLVLADTIPPELDQASMPFDEIVTIEDLGLPTPNVRLWIYQHTVVELCTAVKGQALVNFLERGEDKVIYLDPDIEVFDTLDELDHLIDEYDVLLTPHQTVPEENRRDIVNNEICSLMHGVYNFGFYAVRRSERGLAFARWWRDRLMDFCYDDIPHGIFTDQKWGDLVPAMFDGVYIVKSPAYNVSTWNLTHREITEKDGRYYVNGLPLQFYHFSGFDSGAQKTMLSLYADEGSAAFQLRDLYIRQQQAAGQDTYVKYRSIYDTYDDGTPIRNDERFVLRDRQDVSDYFRDADPYETGEGSYYRWYQAECGGRPASDGRTEDELRAELNAIHVSRAWALVSRWYRLRDKVLPPGSAPRRLLGSAIRKVFGSGNAQGDTPAAEEPDPCDLGDVLGDASFSAAADAAASDARGGALCICHPKGGGTGVYQDQWIAEHREALRIYTLMPRDDGRTADLAEVSPAARGDWHIDMTWPAGDIAKVLQALKITEIHINHLIGCPLPATFDRIAALGIPYHFFLHDYHAICPRYNLVNQYVRYCDVSLDEAICDECLHACHQDVPGGIHAWRKDYHDFLAQAASITAPSQAAADILRRAYPDLSAGVVEHHLTETFEATYHPEDAQRRPLHVAAIGALNPEKGADILYDMARLIRERDLPIRIHVIGYTYRDDGPSDDGILSITGRYEPEELPQLLLEAHAAAVILPAIWPETYCYTASEAMACGYPVISFDIGAPAERIRRTGQGCVIDGCTAEDMLRALQETYLTEKA